MESNSVILTLGVLAGVAVGGYIAYRLYNKMKITEETVNDTVQFDDIVAWFKNERLIKGKHNALIVKESNTEFGELIVKPGYESIGLLILGPNDKIEKMHVVHAKGFDHKTHDIMKNSSVIKLE